MHTREQLVASMGARYSLKRELGRGGTSAVYLAHDTKHGRDVAVKVLHHDVAEGLGATRFVSEIRLLAGLQHPHILPLYDSGQVDGTVYYVMPYVEGETLRALLQRRSPLSTGHALRIAEEIADALAYAHAHNVVHRDIKPENILLSSGHAVVADFGIARAISRAVNESNTQTGLAIGTPAYMSPEQLSGEATVDGRTDVYALGCVLYEMLTGAAPFSGEGLQAALRLRLTQTPEKVTRSHPDVPPEVDTLLARSLAPNPADRYATAGELAAAIAECREASRVRPRRARWRGAVAAAAVVALAASALLFARQDGGGDLDPALFVVLPCDVGDAMPVALGAEECALLLSSALARWDGVTLASLQLVNDAAQRLGGQAASLDDALAIARRLGAGSLAWGQVRRVGDSLLVRAARYDVARPDEPQRLTTTSMHSDLSDASSRFADIADSLLLGASRAAAAEGGAMGTRSLSAWRAYQDGHSALALWDLERAETSFRRAVARDAGYPHAYLWLTLVRSWAGEAPDEWRDDAEMANADVERLSPADQALAAAQLALARGVLDEACRRYDALLMRDSLNFAAWYGRGECRSRDSMVVADPASRSGWRFRSSQHAAVEAHMRALELVPSFHRAFRGAAFSRLPALLFTESHMLRSGIGVGTGEKFRAYPALDADTLAFVPFPSGEVYAGRRGTLPATNARAVQWSQGVLRTITGRWVDAFPRSADAWTAHAEALELEGLIGGASGERGSALAAVDLARSYAADSNTRLDLARRHVRLHVKLGDFRAARLLADSLLSSPASVSPDGAATLASIAALTGRVDETLRLLRLDATRQTGVSTGTNDGSSRTIAQPVRDAALAFSCYAAFGVPRDSLMRLDQRESILLRNWVAPDQRSTAHATLFVVPRSLAFPVIGYGSRVPPGSGDPHLRHMQWALTRGDTASVRSQFAVIRAVRQDIRPGDVAIDVTLQESWLLLALGDTAEAIALLDSSLDALPTLSPRTLDHVTQSAGLVRTMSLRAELAARTGDASTARRWASAVVALWDGADPVLMPRVNELRAIAAAQPGR